MLAELSMIPLGRGTHISDDLASVLKIIDESGIPYCLTPSGTCLEGEWDEVMALIKKCHTEMRGCCTHVFTTVRIEDESGAKDKLNGNVVAVEKAAGRQLKH